MEIDEVSLVDRAACPPATIVIAKRADPEESMSDYTDQDGNELDLDDLEEGTLVEGDDGVMYEVVAADDGDDDYFDESEFTDIGEYAEVGKSAFFDGADSSMIAEIREELSKAVTEEGRDEVLSKAFTVLSKRAEAAEYRLAQAETIAKAERDLRLQREYISKAAEYNVPIDPEELGPVLMRASEALSYDDCAVIHKALVASGEMLYTEAGYDGMGAAEDPISRIDAFLDDEVSKGQKSRASVMTEFFDDNPDAYDTLRAERR